MAKKEFHIRLQGVDGQGNPVKLEKLVHRYVGANPKGNCPNYFTLYGHKSGALKLKTPKGEYGMEFNAAAGASFGEIPNAKQPGGKIKFKIVRKKIVAHLYYWLDPDKV
jgi:hypothetical protein